MTAKGNDDFTDKQCTFYYVCNKCEKPCDIIDNEANLGKTCKEWIDDNK